MVFQRVPGGQHLQAEGGPEPVFLKEGGADLHLLLLGAQGQGVAEIPAVKLFGRSPAGMNATGEADLKNYYELIAQLQERHLRPALEKLLPVMALSAWGTLPEDLGFVFNPIAAESPAETADVVEKLSASVIDAFRAGLLTREEARSELRARGTPFGVWQNQSR